MDEMDDDGHGAEFTEADFERQEDSELSNLEDAGLQHEGDVPPPIRATDKPFRPDAPLYRLRLDYSNETFLADFDGALIPNGSLVAVSTRYGKDLAEVMGTVSSPGSVSVSEIAHIERISTEADLEKARANAKKEKEAFRVAKEKISSHRLDMKLVSVHYLLEEAKVLFFFTAETRVDFRELVKDLVGIFKTRIELRQIGVRDESRVVGGLGVCGRGYCCHTVSDKLKPVSIKMAKDQNLSLNSMKISGPCGRLLCCLAYEHAFYHEERRALPPEGCRILHQGVNWKVIEVNPVSSRLKVAGDDGRYLYLSGDRFERAEGRWRMKEDALRDIEQTAPVAHPR